MSRSCAEGALRGRCFGAREGKEGHYPVTVETLYIGSFFKTNWRPSFAPVCAV